MADTTRSVLPKRRRSMGGPRALRHHIRAAADLRSLLGRRRYLNAFKTRPRAQVGPTKGRYRRISPIGDGRGREVFVLPPVRYRSSHTSSRRKLLIMLLAIIVQP